MQRATTLAVIILFFTSAAAAVCGQPQPRLICAEYFKEQVVVVAKLVHTKEVGEKDIIVGRFYTLSVQKVFRGTIDPTFRVWEENTSGRAGFYWVRGRSYLLFLSPARPNEIAEYDPGEEHTSWVLDGCGNSAPLSKAGKTLKTIERIATEQGGGFITGNVSSESGHSPLEGTSILVRSHGHTYETSTNKDGNFKIHVLAGAYVLSARRPGWLFREDLSYEDPRNIEIQNGSCAQIQFVGNQGP